MVDIRKLTETINKLAVEEDWAYQPQNKQEEGDELISVGRELVDNYLDAGVRYFDDLEANMPSEIVDNPYVMDSLREYFMSKYDDAMGDPEYIDYHTKAGAHGPNAGYTEEVDGDLIEAAIEPWIVISSESNGRQQLYPRTDQVRGYQQSEAESIVQQLIGSQTAYSSQTTKYMAIPLRQALDHIQPGQPAWDEAKSFLMDYTDSTFESVEVDAPTVFTEMFRSESISDGSEEATSDVWEFGDPNTNEMYYFTVLDTQAISKLQDGLQGYYGPDLMLVSSDYRDETIGAENILRLKTITDKQAMNPGHFFRAIRDRAEKMFRSESISDGSEEATSDVWEFGDPNTMETYFFTVSEDGAIEKLKSSLNGYYGPTLAIFAVEPEDVNPDAGGVFKLKKFTNSQLENPGNLFRAFRARYERIANKEDN